MPSVWLAEVFEMESNLATWCQRLPQPFQYAKRALHDQNVANQQSLYIMMHALHHQCRLVLHASLVPKFSGLCLPEGIPPEVTSVSSRIVWKRAEDISCLAADLLNMDWDPAKVPAFVGYCLYASATIHTAMLGFSDAPLAERARMHLVSTLRLLKSLKSFWSVLSKLVSTTAKIFSRYCLVKRALLTVGYQVDANQHHLRHSDAAAAVSQCFEHGYICLNQPLPYAIDAKSKGPGPACWRSSRLRTADRTPCGLCPGVFATTASAGGAQRIVAHKARSKQCHTRRPIRRAVRRDPSRLPAFNRMYRLWK